MTGHPDTTALREALSTMSIEVEPNGGVAVRGKGGSLRILHPLPFKKWCRHYRPGMAADRPASRQWGERAASNRKWHARPDPVQGGFVVWWFRPEGALEGEEDLAKLPAGTRTLALSDGNGGHRIVPNLAVTSSYVRAVGDLNHGWHWITGPLGTIAFHGPSLGAALHPERNT